MDYINYIVIGIGINVENESFPEEIREVATSLRIGSGKRVRESDHRSCLGKPLKNMMIFI